MFFDFLHYPFIAFSFWKIELSIFEDYIRIVLSEYEAIRLSLDDHVIAEVKQIILVTNWRSDAHTVKFSCYFIRFKKTYLMN